VKNRIYLLLTIVIFGVLTFFIQAKADELPDYFICNYWYDSNDDGYLDDDEYVGIKDAFSTVTDSLITFVGYFYDQKGKEIGLKLYQPNETVYSDRTAEAEYDPLHIQRWWYNVKNLANADTGRWIAKWYLEDVIQATKTFMISKPASDYKINEDWLDMFDEYLSDDENTEDFFACNKWVDKNNDDLIDRDEFIGEKKSFNAEIDTTITFVSYWHNKKDSTIKIKIYSPDNELWFEDTATVEYEPIHIHRWPFNVMTMVSKGGLGNWDVRWYLNGEFMYSITIDINKED